MSTIKHCNGCGLDHPKTMFLGKDSRCKVCRGECRAQRHKDVLSDPGLMAGFEAALAKHVSVAIPRDRIVRPGVPTGPGVKAARRAIASELREQGWTVEAIGLFMQQGQASVVGMLK